MNKDRRISQENKTNGSFPFPVPHYMRTYRTLPRIIACTVTVLWLIVLGIGTLALTQRERRDLSPFDQVLREGTSYWGGTLDSTTGTCMVYFKTTFRPPAPITQKGTVSESEAAPLSPNLEINGALRYLVFQKPGFAAFTLSAEFSDLLKLISFTSSLRMGNAELALVSGREEDTVQMKINAGGMLREYSFSGPEPIYLVRRDAGHYSLRLPPQIQKLFEKKEHQGINLNASLQKLDRDNFERCRADVDSNKTHPRGLVDLGNYLSLFRVQRHHSIIEQLTRPGMTSNDQANQSD